MARGRPGGNPNIKEYGFKTDRQHPLNKTMTLRMDEKTKDALQSGELPGWQEIAREAIAKALKEKREKLAKDDCKSA